MAAVGGQVQTWGQRASELAANVSKHAERGSAAGVIQSLVQVRMRGFTPGAPAEGSGRPPCWKDGDQYVSYVHGVPTWSPSQPEGTQLAGTWRGE